MSKTIGYARVSNKAQATDRQITDLIAAGVRRDDLYADHGVSGARAHPPALDMLNLATELRRRQINLRVLNLGGGDVDTGTPMGAIAFTVMAALAQMELDIKRERIIDSVSKRRASGRDLGGRRSTFTTSQIENARPLMTSRRPGPMNKSNVVPQQPSSRWQPARSLFA
ncbi:recombinase family protein [Arthrobacter sp. MA-N2]|uniref:recombinase family protein n=1 Tax=Arthrobacter sp. MA-N2 TaxID=1101188 RepID=UPI0006861B2A|nr:recombinase family protein [Arthrobacter sp. MA-N2]